MDFPCTRCKRVIRGAFTSSTAAKQVAFLLGWRALLNQWYCPDCWPLRSPRQAGHIFGCPGHPCSCRRARRSSADHA